MGADHSRWSNYRVSYSEEAQAFDPKCASIYISEDVYDSGDELDDSALKEAKEESDDLSVSFEYICKRLTGYSQGTADKEFDGTEIALSRENSSSSWASQDSQYLAAGGMMKKARNSSFSSLSGAALSANATLANTTVCNNMIGGVVLPGLDSPRNFRKLIKFPSNLSSASSDFSIATHQFSSSMSPSKSSYLCGSLSSSKSFLSSSAPDSSSNFLCTQDVQMAGGAAGEDRVQAVCSEENGWLFCGIYDGFNGRDAADYLAAHLYEKVGFHLRFLEFQLLNAGSMVPDSMSENGIDYSDAAAECNCVSNPSLSTREGWNAQCLGNKGQSCEVPSPRGKLYEGESEFQNSIINGLRKAFYETESDFFEMVEQEMDDRPDIAMVGSCVLATLIHGQYLFTLNLGDSRAILASEFPSSDSLTATPLTEVHTLENLDEKKRVSCEHADDPSAIIGPRVKGKLRVTRAFGAGYLKSALYNDGLMGILRVRNLQSPPYVSSTPYVSSHRITEQDRFVVVASDGLFDFFSNQEVVDFVWKFISENPYADPASHMLDLLIQRAAITAGISVEDLKNIPSGRRRDFHDDVTIVIITLGDSPKTNSATLS